MPFGSFPNYLKKMRCRLERILTTMPPEKFSAIEDAQLVLKAPWMKTGWRTKQTTEHLIFANNILRKNISEFDLDKGKVWDSILQLHLNGHYNECSKLIELIDDEEHGGLVGLIFFMSLQCIILRDDRILIDIINISSKF